ncbi:MAG: Smr/MutS family protein [Bdellovibrionota bacterium]
MKVGDEVRSKKFKKRGIIIELLKKDQAKVAIGSINMNFKLSDLELVESKNQLLSKKLKKPRQAQMAYNKTSKIDLHGFNVQEAKERLEMCINDAILNQVDQIEVIHGIGSGKVRKAVWVLADELKVVKSIRADQSNPGTSWIYL